MKTPNRITPSMRHEMLTFAKLSLDEGKPAFIRMKRMAGGGSKRSFHRISFGDNCFAIFMHYDVSFEENKYYASIAEFLLKIGVPVPRIIGHDLHRGFIIMEDMGDTDLWSFRHQSWPTRQNYYRKTLNIIHKLHSFCLRDIPTGKIAFMEGFGPALYRWEQNYFIDHFVAGVCKISLRPSIRNALGEELNGLSDRLQKIHPCLIHRDFQSQNIMIKNDEPTLIDFQGMRSGNFFYDLGSLLYDPYVSMTHEERTELLDYYFRLMVHDEILSLDKRESGNFIHVMNDKRKPDSMRVDFILFQEMFQEASVQRIMQALGAYGYLGLKEHMREFLNHIPNGLNNLIDVTARLNNLPLLSDLTQSCKKALQD